MEHDEIIIGDYILRLDGTVVETMHTSGINQRLHVNHVVVDARQAGRDLRLHIGIEPVGGMVTNGSKLTVPEAQIDAVKAFFARATARRTTPR